MQGRRKIKVAGSSRSSTVQLGSLLDKHSQYLNIAPVKYGINLNHCQKIFVNELINTEQQLDVWHKSQRRPVSLGPCQVGQ